MTDDPFLAPPSQPSPQPPPPTMAPATPLAPQPDQQGAPPPPPNPAAYPPPGYAPANYSPPGYAQPGYAQPGAVQPAYPPNMPPPMPYWNAPLPKTWMNWVAFGCGLGALVTCISFIPAIIFGHLGLAAAKRGEADKRGFGITGLVIGYVYLAGFIAYIALIVGLGVSGGIDS